MVITMTKFPACEVAAVGLDNGWTGAVVAVFVTVWVGVALDSCIKFPLMLITENFQEKFNKNTKPYKIIMR